MNRPIINDTAAAPPLDETTARLPRLNELSISMGILHMILDEACQALFLNDYLISELGYESWHDLTCSTGGSFLSCIHPEDVNFFQSYLTSLRKLRHKNSCTCRLRSKSGEFLWFEIVASLSVDYNKEFATCFCINISQSVKQQQDEEKAFAVLREELETIMSSMLGGLQASRNTKENPLDCMSVLKEAVQLFQIVVGSTNKIIAKYDFKEDRFIPVGSSSKEFFSKLPGPLTLNRLMESNMISSESMKKMHVLLDQMSRGIPKGEMNIRVLSAQGLWQWYHCAYTTVFDINYLPVYSIIFCENITTIHENELASRRFFDYMKVGTRKIVINLEYNLTLDTFERSHGAIPSCYADAFTKSYTEAFERMSQDVLPKYRNRFRSCFLLDNLLERFEKGINYEVNEFMITFGGEPVWIRVLYQILKDPLTSFMNIWISCRDIQAEKQTELKLVEMARIDEVTRISNRAALMERVMNRPEASIREMSWAIVMLDVDGFGRVNDILGHAYGDSVLKDIAQTLKLVIAPEDLVARIGGDEFVIYVNDFSDLDAAKERLRIILAAVYRELKIGIKVSISAGVAFCPCDGNNFETLYEKADIALYHAKLTGRNKYVIYNNSMQKIDGSTMITPIDEAISPNTGVYIRTFGYFEVFLNGEAIPIQNVKAKELLALLVDRRGGFVSPGDIISCLWENEPVNKVTLARCRKVIMLLRNALSEYNLEDLIESKKGLRRLNTGMAHCDLYNYLSGKPEYAHLFNGVYMLNYSWGELMLSELKTCQ